MSQSPPRILHLHSTFDPGGKEVRCVRLINSWGRQAGHAIVSGQADRRGAAKLLDGDLDVMWPNFPSLAGKPAPARLKKMAAAMAGYDLICTYNWGAIDAVMAHSLFAGEFNLPPLVHHEDGFNEDEASALKKRRNWYRRVALRRAAVLVVPSRSLERIALQVWRQPADRVQRISNGIDTPKFAVPPPRDSLPGLTKKDGEFWIGSLAGLRKVKNLGLLVRAIVEMPPEWRLVIAGEGAERENLLKLADDLGVAQRVHLPGFIEKPEEIVGLFDIFALSSHSEQFPISVVEAMAAGLPVAAPRVGDIADMVAPENDPFLVDPGDEAALVMALRTLAAAAQDRAEIGQKNRTKVRDEYDFQTMTERYQALYWGLMDRSCGA